MLVVNNLQNTVESISKKNNVRVPLSHKTLILGEH